LHSAHLASRLVPCFITVPRYLLAFIGAGFTSVATILAFSDLGELVAFFLAIVANHLDGFSKMAGMVGIDRCKRV
jgi:hypothetical protein